MSLNTSRDFCTINSAWTIDFLASSRPLVACSPAPLSLVTVAWTAMISLTRFPSFKRAALGSSIEAEAAASDATAGKVTAGEVAAGEMAAGEAAV